MAIYLDAERGERHRVLDARVSGVLPESNLTSEPAPLQPDVSDERAKLANQIAVGVERFVDAFLRPPVTLHASLFIACGGYWRRVCTCGYVSGPHVSESAAHAEPCPREAADTLHRLRLANDKDEILTGLRALAASGK